jgi:hypothetical protein
MSVDVMISLAGLLHRIDVDHDPQGWCRAWSS